MTTLASDDSALFVVLYPAALLGIGLWLGWRMFRRARKLFLREKRRADELTQDLKALRSQVLALRLEAEGRRPRLPLLFKATTGEDFLLFELFNPPGRPLRTSGLAIECGAHDGESISITYIFDALGWDCVLVEPLPHLAERCRSSRPKARVVQAALSKRGSTGVASIRMIENNEGRSFLEGSEHGARSTTKDSRIVEVPLTTMDAVLGDETRQVDFLVLDVEGAELSVLDGFDLDRHRPRAMLIEDHGLGEESALVDHLAARGYRHTGWIWRNRLFVRNDDAELLGRAAELFQTNLGLRSIPG